MALIRNGCATRTVPIAVLKAGLPSRFGVEDLTPLVRLDCEIEELPDPQ